MLSPYYVIPSPRSLLEFSWGLPFALIYGTRHRHSVVLFEVHEFKVSTESINVGAFGPYVTLFDASLDPS